MRPKDYCAIENDKLRVNLASTISQDSPLWGSKFLLTDIETEDIILLCTQFVVLLGQPWHSGSGLQVRRLNERSCTFLGMIYVKIHLISKGCP